MENQHGEAPQDEMVEGDLHVELNELSEGDIRHMLELPITIVPAERALVNTKLELREGQVVAVSNLKHFDMLVEWPEALLEKAMWFNIVPYVEARGAHTLVKAIVETLHAGEADERVQPVAEWDGYAAAQAVSFKLKNSDKRVHRLDRVNKLLSSINDTAIDIVAAETRLRQLQNTSPTPHGESGELRFGSSAEIAAANQRVTDLRASIEEKRAEVNNQLTKINEALTPFDSGWEVQLPEAIDAVTRLNEKTYDGE